MVVTLFDIVKEVPVFASGYLIIIVLSLLYNTPSCELFSLLPGSTFISVRLVHPLKAAPATKLTLAGMVMLVRLVQPSKVKTSMVVTLFDMVTLARLIQPLKACIPMDVTLFGMVILHNLSNFLIPYRIKS